MVHNVGYRKCAIGERLRIKLVRWIPFRIPFIRMSPRRCELRPIDSIRARTLPPKRLRSAPCRNPPCSKFQ